MKGKKGLDRESVIKDYLKVFHKYRKENNSADNLFPSRDYYLNNGGIYTEREISNVIGSFSILKKESEKIIESDIKLLKLKYDQIIKTLKDEIKELNTKNSYLLDQTINDSNILSTFEDSLKKNIKFPDIKQSTKNTTHKDIILQICDIHLGEIVEPQYVNYTNKYNKDICIKRLDKIFEILLEKSDKIGVDNLYLLLNGDLISGGIHLENVRNSDLNEVESIIYLNKYFVQKIVSIARNFKNIEIDIIVGNHGRILTGKPYFKEKTTMSYEYIFANMLKMYFDTLRDEGKNNTISINIPESPFTIKKVKNLKFLVTHGDILSGSGGGGFAGIPFYAICSNAAKLYGILHQIGVDETVQFDHILYGHLHTTSKTPLFNGGFAFGGGCVIGTNEFSLYKMKSVAKKEQLALIIDEKGIDGEINIKFE